MMAILSWFDRLTANHGQAYELVMSALVDQRCGAGVVSIYDSFVGIECKSSSPINGLLGKSKIK